MGLTYAALKLTNLFTHQVVEIKALVDTGATFMCVTEVVPCSLVLILLRLVGRWLPWQMGISARCLRLPQSK